MIVRRVAARHCRRIPKASCRNVCRQYATEASTKPASSEQPSSWPTEKAAGASPQPTLTMAKKKQKFLEEMILKLTIDSAHEKGGAAWTRTHKIPGTDEVITPAAQYKEFRRIQGNTKKLGSHVERRYSPTQLFLNPPSAEALTLELLMASQTHMGHNKALWNPANSRYIYGVRQGIHIIALETTAAHLRRAARVVEEVAFRGGLILFVGNRRGQMEITTKAAELAGACHLFTKWTPGAITNRDMILGQQATRVVNQKDEPLDGFATYGNTVRPLVPDLVVCLNPLENYTLLYECGLKNIPTIGIIDTNVDPSWVTYTIPANDDSYRSVGLIAGVLGRAGQSGQERRLEQAESGKSTWETKPELAHYMNSEIKAAIKKRKEVMGRVQEGVEGFTEDEQNLLNSRISEPQQSVSHNEMLHILGQATAEETDGVMTEAAQALQDHSTKANDAVEAGLREIEAELRAVRESCIAVESAIARAPKQ